jgi:pimeloyl-ACP methyl ester carboxylesterase
VKADLRSPPGNRVEEKLHPPVGRVHVDGDEMRLRAPHKARFKVLVEPLAQLQAEGEVGDLEKDGPGHSLSFAGGRPSKLVHSRHFPRMAHRWDTRRVEDALPEVRYARSGDVHLAYQVLGQGDVDLVFVMGWLTNLETYWDLPGYRRFMQRLAGFTRLILFDKRGMGLSDHTAVGTLEERMDDVRAVMDAAGSERAVLMGISEGAPLSMVFAATHPERTAALIFVGGEVKEILEDDWPLGQETRDEYEGHLQKILSGEFAWGQPKRVWFAPSKGNDPAVMEWVGRLERTAASPAAAVAFMRLGSELDVRHVAPSIHVPTLVMHAPEDPIVPFAQGRWLAEQIEGARFVELAGKDHVPWFDVADQVVAETREFLTGFREASEPEQILATVLFTDIVGSTERAQELGNREWRSLLEQHHTTVREILARYRGREIDTAGDGFLASFDGPARAIRCAVAVRDALAGLGIPVRSGLHTGEVEVVGEKLAGIAVHTGSRVVAVAAAGEVLVSSTVRDLVAGSGIEFEDRGLHELKGLDEPRRLFAVA